MAESNKIQLSHRPRGGVLQFVQVSHPSDATSWKKVVRAHAAKDAHAKARRARVAEHQKSKGSVSVAPPILDRRLVPSPKTLLSASTADPFASFARVLTTFESFLLHHYREYVVVHGAVCDHFDNIQLYKHGMGTHWVQLAATDAGMVSAIMLSSCRSLANLRREDVYLRGALTYKGVCIRSVNEDISRNDREVGDATIAKSMALASDSFLTGDLATAGRHIDGVRRMVELKGGVQQLSMFLGQLVKWFTTEPLLKSNSILEYTCEPVSC